MVAPVVAQEIVTVTDPVYVPGAGLNVGVATLLGVVIVYTPLAASLSVIPLLNARALKVVVVVKVSGLV